jgi:ABC-type glycerol-3-phosphate transport system substrate-binding protein
MDLSADLALGLQLNDPSTDWRVAPTPTRTTRNKPINFAGGSTLVIPSTAKHPKEALAFILWLTSQQGQRLKYGLDNSLGLSKQDLYTGAVPANRAVAQVLRKDPNWKQALATVEVPTRTDGPSPVFSKAYQVLADMQARIILKNTNVMAELKAAQRQVQKLLDQGIKANPELYKR